MSQLLPGHGLLELTQVRQRTEITRSQATNPLKLITPRRQGDAAWVYCSTFGGGLVAGDQIHLDLQLSEQTTCVLGTQASTKVYRDPNQIGCTQTFKANIDRGALLVSVPDPITCFAEAVYEQEQQFHLAPEGSSTRSPPRNTSIGPANRIPFPWALVKQSRCPPVPR